ncbi:hypothetical protein AAV94_08830 [Lampropedia cohaerens]|uniref:Phosphatidic acid phosphatase type 2/haloperoxidase domain-containing protein n=1 Tax=Lampropedia cohaerens TaxID=1610491 RepID=A0A0U1PZ87_9BURK|nr:hypothetical protein AAV94_08830 [Lampropedia cohaerens]
MCVALQQRLRHPALLALMRTVSRLGNGIFWYALMALLLAAGHLQAAFRMAVAGVAGVLLYKWLKKVTSRPRPYARGGTVVALTAPLDEFSFPSGHTLHAVAFTLVACFYLPLLAWVLVPFTLLIALSRVVLGLHFPSDVLAGAAIGSLLAVLVLMA